MGNLTCTASGSVANFYTPYAVPIRSFKVHFSPKQSGTGDPSPSNVRPIEGWTGVTGYRDKKSVVWNQLVQNGNFVDASRWTTANASFGSVSVSNNVIKWQCIQSPIDYYYRSGFVHDIDYISIPYDHKVLISIDVKSSIAKPISVYGVTVGVTYYCSFDLNSTDWTRCVGFINDRPTDDKIITRFKVCYRSVSMSYVTVGTTLEAKNFMAFDLTQMFGKGNEPETFEEFESLCTLNGINLDEYQAYDEGTAIGWKTADTDEIPVTFPAVGKNLFDESSVIYGAWTDNNGNISTSARGCISDKIPINNNSSLLLVHLGESPYSYSIIEYDSEGEFIARYHNNGNGSNVQPVVVSSLNSNTRYVSIQVTSSYSSAAPTITPEVLSSFKMMLVYGNDIPTEYEVYKGNTYYGGYVDLVSGEVVQEWKCVDLGDFTYTFNDVLTGVDRFAKVFDDYGGILSSGILCPIFKQELINYSNNNFLTWRVCVPSTSSKQFWFYTPAGTYADTSEFTTAMSGVKMAYLLETPITHTLSPQTLSTLVHDNAFWSNADSVEIEYDLAECGDIKEIRRRILLSTPHLETVSGSVAHFKTDMASKLKECRVNFLPQQAGSGDPSPSNVRAISGWTGCDVVRSGKNIVQVLGYSAQTNNSKTGNRNLTNAYGTTISTTDFTLPDTQLVITQSQWDDSVDIHNYRNGYSFIVVDNLEFGQSYNVSFRVSNITNNPFSASLNNIRLSNPNGNATIGTLVSEDRLLFQGVRFTQSSSAPNRSGFTLYNCGMSFTLSEFMVTPVEDEDYTYAPYDPDQITVSFPQIGKNYFNINHFSGKTGVTISGNTITATASTLASVCGRGNGTYMPLSIASGNTITISFDAYTDGNVGTTGDGLALVLIYSDGTYARFAYTSNSETTSTPHTATTTLSKDVAGFAFGYYENTGNIWHLSNVQLEIGSTATAFEPYTNTIYGGYIDLLKGELVQEYSHIVVDGVNVPINNVYTSTADRYRWYTPVNGIPGLDYGAGKQAAIMASNMPCTENGSSATTSILPSIDAGGLSAQFFISVPRDYPGTKEGANAWLQQNPIDVVYKLATPITYPLSPEIIKAIKGVNNVWSDANGDVEVKFWTH